MLRHFVRLDVEQSAAQTAVKIAHRWDAGPDDTYSGVRPFEPTEFWDLEQIGERAWSVDCPLDFQVLTICPDGRIIEPRELLENVWRWSGGRWPSADAEHRRFVDAVIFGIYQAIHGESVVVTTTSKTICIGEEAMMTSGP